MAAAQARSFTLAQQSAESYVRQSLMTSLVCNATTTLTKRTQSQQQPHIVGWKTDERVGTMVGLTMVLNVGSALPMGLPALSAAGRDTMQKFVEEDPLQK